jgi:hypothetical protein
MLRKSRISRRGFLTGAAATAGAAGLLLAGCTSGEERGAAQSTPQATGATGPTAYGFGLFKYDYWLDKG